MFSRIKGLTIMMILIIMILVGCDGTIEKKLVGDWKLLKEGEVENYWEIKEERILLRTMSEDNPKSAEYILTETQDDNFVLETIDSVNDTPEFLFEGHFENDDTLKSVKNSGGSIELIRVDNIAKDMSKEKAKAKVKKKKAEAVKEKEEKEEKIKVREEEEKKKEEEAKVKEEEKQKKEEIAKKNESEHEPEYMREEEWETCRSSDAYSEKECIDIDQYYAHGDGRKELEEASSEEDKSYEWAEGVKENFEADIYGKEYVDSIEKIRYEKYEPNGYPQGLYSVYGEVEGIENYVVVVDVKTGDYHG